MFRGNYFTKLLGPNFSVSRMAWVSHGMQHPWVSISCMARLLCKHGLQNSRAKPALIKWVFTEPKVLMKFWAPWKHCRKSLIHFNLTSNLRKATERERKKKKKRTHLELWDATASEKNTPDWSKGHSESCASSTSTQNKWEGEAFPRPCFNPIKLKIIKAASKIKSSVTS